MTKERGQILRNMRGGEGNKEYRPEQVRLYNYIREMGILGVEMEFLILDLKEVDQIKPKPVIADIFIPQQMGIPPKVIRLMGEVHESERRRMKDEEQRVVLEGNGYIVEDFWWDDFPELFKGNDDDSKTEFLNFMNGKIIRKRY